MGKIIVIYHSQQFGNTRVLAEALAEGALYTGAKLMMKNLGLRRLDKVILAGAFGSYIDKEGAMVLGVFSDCDPKNVYAAGNAAGDKQSDTARPFPAPAKTE